MYCDGESELRGRGVLGMTCELVGSAGVFTGDTALMGM